MQNTQEYSQIIQILENLLSGQNPWKMVFSKPKIHGQKTRSITVTPIDIRNQRFCKCVAKEDTKDLTFNETSQEFLQNLPRRLQQDFMNLDIFSATDVYQCLQSKKGKLTVLKKTNQHVLSPHFEHDHQKTSYINNSAKYYKELGLISGTGNVFSKGQKKYNQVNKYLEIIHHLLDGKTMERRFRIVDMGSGKAYLTFAVYDYLKNYKNWDLQITGYEARQDLVDTCNKIAKACGMENLVFEAKNINEVPPQTTDMVIALHACDIATDMAIAYGVQNAADTIILAPCCHKQVRKAMEIPGNLQPVLKHGILWERQAEILTDGLRSLIMEYHGYSTKVFEFISLEHTGKNVMIIAEKAKKNPQAKEAYESLKNTFGIQVHYLEKILPFS